MQRLDVFQSSFATKTNFRTCHAHLHTRTHTHTGKNADLCALGQSWSTLDRKWRPTCCQMPIQSVLPLPISLYPSLSVPLSLSLWWHTNAICIIDCDCHLLRLAVQHVASARLGQARLVSTRLVAAREALSIWIYVGICLNNLYSAGGLSCCCCCHSCRSHCCCPSCCCCCICSFGAVFGGRLFWAWVLVVVVEFRNLFVVKCN